MREDELNTPDGRVWLGASLLDRMARRLPHVVHADWVDCVDLDEFDIGYMSTCVISFAVPDLTYDEACDALGLVTRQRALLAGFCGDSCRDCDELTRAWTELILARRAAN